MSEKFRPIEENLGKNCAFWAGRERGYGCFYPKVELSGRLSCEGIIDEVCLFRRSGRPTSTLSEDQIREIKTQSPLPNGGRRLPAGKRLELDN